MMKCVRLPDSTPQSSPSNAAELGWQKQRSGRRNNRGNLLTLIESYNLGAFSDLGLS